MCFTPEAYPTDIRTTAVGIAIGIRNFSYILSPIITSKIWDRNGTIPLILASILLIITSIFTYFLPFDTRKKRLIPIVRDGL